MEARYHRPSVLSIIYATLNMHPVGRRSMNKLNSPVVAAALWGFLVIFASAAIVNSGTQVPRCTGDNACTGNTGTVAFGSCNGDE
jgi:hypothetical protein